MPNIDIKPTAAKTDPTNPKDKPDIDNQPPTLTDSSTSDRASKPEVDVRPIAATDSSKGEQTDQKNPRQ